MELLFPESPLILLVDYPADVAAIESLVVCGRLVYFVSAKGPKTVGGLYSFNLAGGPVDVLVYDPVDKIVSVLVGSGQKGNDGKKLTFFNRTESTLYGKPAIFVCYAATVCTRFLSLDCISLRFHRLYS